MFKSDAEKYALQLIAEFNAFTEPFTNHIVKRIILAGAIVLGCTLLQRFLMLFWPKNRLRLEVCEIDYNKRHHWQLFSIVAGLFMLPGIEDPVCTLPMLIRRAGDCGEFWLILVVWFLYMLFWPALFRSLQYLRYFGPICPLDIWLDYLKHMGYGMLIYQGFEGIFRLFFLLVGNSTNGWLRFFFQICLCAQVIIPVKILLKAIGYFGSSFFTRATREELSKQYTAKAAERQRNYKPSQNSDSASYDDDSDSYSAFPSVIVDDSGNVYRLQHSGGDTASYSSASTGQSVSFHSGDLSDGLPNGWREGN